MHECHKLWVIVAVADACQVHKNVQIGIECDKVHTMKRKHLVPIEDIALIKQCSKNYDTVLCNFACVSGTHTHTQLLSCIRAAFALILVREKQILCICMGMCVYDSRVATQNIRNNLREAQISCGQIAFDIHAVRIKSNSAIGVCALIIAWSTSARRTHILNTDTPIHITFRYLLIESTENYTREWRASAYKPFTQT